MKHTIYKSLGYDKIGRGEWSVFDISDGRESRVGIIYPTEKELLRNLDNYAADYGCEEADKTARIRAAAPDLLRVLQCVLIASEDCGTMNDIDWNEIRSAISRATGE